VSGVGELKRVLIYGAGGSGIITKNTLLQDSASRYDIAGFIDDNTSKIGKTLEGIRIYGPNQVFNDFLNKNDISEVIISIQNISSLRKREMIELCMEKNVSVKTVPPAQKWINGELSSNQIKNIRIEDLLERDSIELSNENISREIDGKVIFVTGAAGSIGSEIVRQLLNFHPLKVVLIDQAESPLYDLEFELKNKHDASRFEVVVCDVTNYSRLNKAFQHFRPDHVFHAAAYKHVPLMELNPYEAVNVNIMGTRNLANLASEYKVSKFVFVSTDKAVNPTNVMGATKRAAEIYVQSLNANSSTSFITTRFGNVLGSNGSVIPTFRKQIENGGPITVTHKEITRYFMTIPEACQLVLEAGAMGKGGEIYVFDMGESVKIYDLATKMIKLSGLTLGKDIEIKITGLRPGEKLYEELLNEAETTMPTHHPKIMIGKVNEYPLDTVKDGLDEVSNLLQNSNDNMLLVRKLKELVPEYISKNSMYSQLDKEKTG
jgi:FlaA1/EpsC-like NDP-sugar epimerase